MNIESEKRMARSSLKSVMRLLDDVNIEPAVEESFLYDLKRSIEKTEYKNRRLPSQTYKPSGMNCIRSMYYQIIGVEPTDSPANYSNVGICNSGSDIHQRIQQAVLDMKGNDIDCEYINVADYVRSRNFTYLDIVKEPDFEHGDYETKLFHKPLNMSFLCDGIIKYKGKYYILELKTEASFKFNSRGEVDKKHYNQGTAYSLAFGIDDVIFVYINRDLLDMKSYMFHVTDEMRNELVNKITECDSYVDSKTTPPKPEMSNKVCAYCSYKQQCDRD